MKIIKVKLFYWQIQPPESLWGWLTVPINKRVVVGCVYIKDSKCWVISATK